MNDINGPNPYWLRVGETYVEHGTSSFFFYNEIIFSSEFLQNGVAAVLGEHTVTYKKNASFLSPAQYQVRTVHVYESPTVTFLGDNPAYYLRSEGYNDPGITVSSAYPTTGWQWEREDFQGLLGDDTTYYYKITNANFYFTHELTAYARTTTAVDPPEISLNGEASLILEYLTTWQDPGATSSDTVTVEYSEEFAAASTGLLFVLGTFTATYTATSTHGFTTSVTRTIEVAASPTVTLLGPNPLYHLRGESLDDPGAESNMLEITGLPSGSNGVYRNTGLVADGSPVYQLVGSESRYILKYRYGSFFSGYNYQWLLRNEPNRNSGPSGLIAYRAENQSLVAEGGQWYMASSHSGFQATVAVYMATPGTVDLAEVGSVDRTYSVTDDATGFTASATRTIVVADLPTIELQGLSHPVMVLSYTWNDPGATSDHAVTDSAPFRVASTGQLLLTGTFTVTYTTTDPTTGFTNSVVRTVTVVPDPTITLNGDASVTLAYDDILWQDPGASGGSGLPVVIGDQYDYTVTVGAASSGSGNKYYIDGVEAPALTLAEGRHRFAMGANVTSHPFIFTEALGAGSGSTAVAHANISYPANYQQGGVVEIIVTSEWPGSSSSLYYGCAQHANMGSATPIATTGTFNRRQAGSHTITYTATDSHGFTATTTRTVTVQEAPPVVPITDPPVITVAPTTVLPLGTAFVDDYATTGVDAALVTEHDHSAGVYVREGAYYKQTTGLHALVEVDTMSLVVGSEQTLDIGDFGSFTRNGYVYRDEEIQVPLDRSGTAFHTRQGYFWHEGTNNKFAKNDVGDWVAWKLTAWSYFCVGSSGDSFPGQSVREFWNYPDASGGNYPITSTLRGGRWAVVDWAPWEALSYATDWATVQSATHAYANTWGGSWYVWDGSSTFVESTVMEVVSSQVSVAVDGAVQENVPGEYTLTYTATDNASGLSATAQHVVTVVGPPTITLVGDSVVTVEHLTSWSDPGATSDATVSASVPVELDGFALVGSYTITYTATDVHGLTSTITRTVNVVLPPTLSLNGPSPQLVETGTAWEDPGATGGGTVSASGNVDTSAAGTYPVVYTATDQFGFTTSLTRIVEVVDPPVVTLEGAASVIIEYLTVWHDPGATSDAPVATTYSSPFLEPTTSTVYELGSFAITYTATDAATGFTSSVSRAVQVSAPPTLTLEGDATMTLATGSTWVDPGYQSTVATTVSGDVDTSATGIYVITYTALDASTGLNATLSRTVVVADPPTVQMSGTSPVYHPLNTSYADAGATGPSLVTTGAVDTALAGSYTLTYTATDTSTGLTATAQRIVVVAGPPTIILQGETEGIEVRYGTPWTDPGYIVGPGVSVNADALDTAVSGVVTLTYVATDDVTGFTSTATRTVTVLAPAQIHALGRPTHRGAHRDRTPFNLNVTQDHAVVTLDVSSTRNYNLILHSSVNEISVILTGCPDGRGGMVSIVGSCSATVGDVTKSIVDAGLFEYFTMGDLVTIR